MPAPSYVDTERMVEVDWVEQRLAGVRARALLDVGSADLYYFDALVATGAQITLMDLAPFRPPDPLPASVTPVQADVCAMPEAWTGQYDIVTCISTLDHIADVETAARELARVTRPAHGKRVGGRLLLTMPIGAAQTVTHRDGFMQHVFEWDALLALFAEGGWTLNDSAVWRLRGDVYIPCAVDDIRDCGYAHYRAEAAGALDLCGS